MNETERICVAILMLMAGITFYLIESMNENIYYLEQSVVELNDMTTTTVKPQPEIDVLKETAIPMTEMEAIYLANTPAEEITEISEIYPIPEYDTSFKAYMDYRKITDTTTPQWLLQQQAWTDEYGLRKLNSDYMVALGTGYTNEIGDRFQITLNNGEVFTVVVGDIKADVHTDDSCRYVRIDNESVNVLEFIVDTNKLKENIKITGTVGTYPHLSGNIIKIGSVQD